jgi:hypothetical protein
MCWRNSLFDIGLRERFSGRRVLIYWLVRVPLPVQNFGDIYARGIDDRSRFQSSSHAEPIRAIKQWVCQYSRSNFG